MIAKVVVGVGLVVLLVAAAFVPAGQENTEANAACCVRQDGCTKYLNPSRDEPQQCADQGGFWLPGGVDGTIQNGDSR